MITLIVAALDARIPFEIRETVRDWTATGLLTGTIWVDTADLVPGALDTPCLVVEPGRDPRVGSVRSILGSHESLAEVRVVSVQVVGDPAAQVEVDAVQALRQQIADSGVRVLRLNLLVPADADPRAQPAPIMLSTPNVVLQPADSANGSAPGVPVDAASPVFVAHCAGGLATVAGVWAGQEASPYDADQMWVSAQAEMVRWYRRAVDGGTVWSGLRSSIAPEVGPPVAVDAGGRRLDVAQTHEVPAQVQRAHDSLLTATSGLTGPAARQPFVPPPPHRIGFGQAIKEFFAFLATALRNAPARWLRGVVDDVSTGIARRATDAIYGQGADVQVMFNGRVPSRADGTSEDIGALSSAAAGVFVRLTGHLPVPPRVTEFADLYTFAATALLDGAERPDSGVVLPTRGAQPVVVGDASLVAPAPDAPLFRVPPGLGMSAADAVVTPWSPFSAMRVREQLVALEQQEVNSGGGHAGRLAEIQKARTQLDEWAGGQGGFSWQVQLTIAKRMETARNEFAAAASELQQDPVDDSLQDLVRQEARERRRVRWTLLALPLIVVVIVLCALLTPVLVTVVVAVVALLVWAAVLVFCVLAAQRLAWQLMHRRDIAAARRAWLAQQVELMAREIYRLGIAYGCAESWSRVLSGVVHRPFGVRDGVGAAAATVPADTPLGMQSAVGRFESGAMAEMVNVVRRHVVPAGWLGEELRRRVREIAIARQREGGFDAPVSAFDDPGVDLHGELLAAAVRVNEPAVERRAGMEFDGRVRQAIEHVERSRGGAWALESITVGDDNGAGARATGGTRTAAEFLAPLLVEQQGRLPEIGFVGGGSTDGAATVEAPIVVRTSGVGMSSLPGFTGGTVFDRGVIRLDRGRRCDPGTLGVAAPAGGPTPPDAPDRDDDF